MSKYSILTCIFSGYEQIREVIDPDPDIEYILVTDNQNLKSDTWQIKYYPQLLDYPEGPDRWAYIRYHPFEFVNTDICLYIDGSIQILSSPKEMLEKFEKEEWEYGTLQNTITNDIRYEVRRWAYYGYYGFQKEDSDRVCEFLDKNNYNSIGLLQSTMIIYKNTKFTHKINDHTWTTMFIWGKPWQADRINQTALTYAVWKMAYHDPRFILMHPRFLWSKWFDYRYHGTEVSQKDGFHEFVNMTNDKNELIKSTYNFQDRIVFSWVPEI